MFIFACENQRFTQRFIQRFIQRLIANAGELQIGWFYRTHRNKY